ncbi:RNA-binding protein [Alkalihalobacillus sp. AL-G]|uniref:YlmH family RNA-binding protein n=1 Tax=Alkalihalobacillus sp. AL-G TaxID=2926399 RepID=UPI00272D978C|nr:RNA-binding protein [Alkalihalobacillus sp. AL-G]WLD95082.1 RNA-binding protein [Alkalihalobacillus sp. AL-G]
MKLYQHFRPEEQPFVDQILEWHRMVLDQYSLKKTDFLDPRERFILESVIGKNEEVHFSFWEGYNNIERTRGVLYPNFLEPDYEDYDVQCYQLEYPHKFVTVQHPDVLGALMNLGLRREKFGDILVNGETIQLIVAKEISEYVELNLTAVGKVKVELRKIDSTELHTPDEQWNEQSGTVSSLRLDAILAEAFHLSRSKVGPYIQGKKVKLNWKLIEQTSVELQQGDTISVRGLGRAKLLQIDGQTKKEKWRIVLGIKKSK